MNYLEQLVAEYYMYQDYFVRHNVRVGRRSSGGYEGELDVVAFHPEKQELVHIETSMDADSWSKRSERLARKFDVGQRYIPALFRGIELPQIKKRAVFGLDRTMKTRSIEGVELLGMSELLEEVVNELHGKSWWSHSVPENFPLLRTIQIAVEYKGVVTGQAKWSDVKQPKDSESGTTS